MKISVVLILMEFNVIFILNHDFAEEAVGVWCLAFKQLDGTFEREEVFFQSWFDYSSLQVTGEETVKK
eukprot:JP440888.1.p1 GENE.JP440888.1~~JP440888.1.p1  ORF type:complete len:68 (+),score=6.03 JP440888.1:7-210(+)